MEDIEDILDRVSRRISPCPKERAKTERIADGIRLRVSEAAKEASLEADVRLDGSVAKDTWLSGEADIDIFMRVPRELAREELGTKCLAVAKKAVESYVERYAEHPYIETMSEGVRINIVPCFNVEKGKWKSATDRTPFHTEYMRALLDERLKNEIRLTKKFAKGIGVYGAEIKTKGFSGMLCETLTLHHQSFKELLRAAATWKPGQLIDIEGFYKGLEEDIPDLFPEPLVVVDPVDKGRNMAAAVTEEKMWLFVSAARHFLEKPKLGFFYPPSIRRLTSKQIARKLAMRGSDTIFIHFGKVDAVVDVLWSQLYKTENSLRNLLKTNGFQVLRTASWSDERKLNLILFELNQRKLPPLRSHPGPPVWKKSESEKFVMKHLRAADTVSGPRVEEDRWMVEKKRRYTDAATLITEKLNDGGKTVGVASRISPVLKKNLAVLVNEEIADVCRKNQELSVFLTEHLKGRPSWLE